MVHILELIILCKAIAKLSTIFLEERSTVSCYQAAVKT